jgi:ubiquinone/menaquinone biosynthesis C-methylase UbiE
MSNPAETYETAMVPTFFAPWASVIVDHAAPRPGERVLDVACGTGIVARRVAARRGPTGTVVGLDLNPHMLAVARAVADQEALSIEWHEGRAEDLPFPDRSFDLVLCQFALMFFADRRAAVAEMHRGLAGGGRVVVSVLQSLAQHPFYQLLDETIQRRFGMSGVAAIFSLGDEAEFGALFADAGFGGLTIEPVSMTACFPDPARFLAMEIEIDTAAIPSMQHLDAAARRDVVEAIRAEMEPTLRQHTRDHRVELPFHALIARGNRGRA